MAKMIRGITKGISAVRLQHIENYEVSLGSLFNPNLKGMLAVNPIQGYSALSTLEELKEELGAITIDAKEIDCNRVYNRIDLTEVERFILGINNGLAYSRYADDYKKMLSDRELLEAFPMAERKKRVAELEQEIKRELMKSATVGKINKSLKKSCDEKAEELRKELNSILETMDIIEESYINNMLYMLASGKLAEIKNRIDWKINYLNEVLGC